MKWNQIDKLKKNQQIQRRNSKTTTSFILQKQTKTNKLDDGFQIEGVKLFSNKF